MEGDNFQNYGGKHQCIYICNVVKVGVTLLMFYFFYCIIVPHIPNQIQLVEMPPSSVTVFWDSLFPLDYSGINFDVMVTNVTSGETIMYKDILRRE